MSLTTPNTRAGSGGEARRGRTGPRGRACLGGLGGLGFLSSRWRLTLTQTPKLHDVANMTRPEGLAGNGADADDTAQAVLLAPLARWDDGLHVC